LQRGHGVGTGRARVAHNGLAALGRERGFDGGRGMVEAPGEKGVVYELLLRISFQSSKANK
jgi:hypothetical protein